MALPLHSRRRTSRASEGGYVLLTLLLAMALLVIFAAVIVPSIKFQIERDREEELIHRGVQYSRAIRAFYKKFGRYPIRLEELENSNNMRFLRKRYKDPMNCNAGKCQDFKLLHFGEVQMTLSGIGGGTIPGATSVAAMGAASSSAFGQSSSFGSSGGLGQSSSFGSSSGFGQSSSFGSSSGFGANSNSSFGQSQQSTNNQTAGTYSSQSGSQTSDSTGANSSSGNGSSNSGSNSGSGQIIGGPIVGVATTSKKATIREFNHKKKYCDWAFVYDPAQDLGFLITTPYQQQLAGFGQSTPNLNGQSGTNGNSSAFGSGSGFGSGTFGSSSSGMQNNSPGGFGTTSQPSNPPQQQRQ